MVRILSCHHFVGQKIGKCEEAVGVALANTAVIVALEHQVNIYTAEKSKDLHSWFINKRSGISFGKGELGKPFLFETKEAANHSSPVTPTGPSTLHPTKALETELRLSHFFAPVDLINSISYNTRG